jgi:hypothetical protein
MSDVQLLPPITYEEVREIHEMLQAINIPLKNETNTRRGFGKHRCCTFGVVRKRFTNKIELSAFSSKHHTLFRKLFLFGMKFVPFQFETVHVNQDVQAPMHKDAKNTGKSVIVSFGDYEGGLLVVDRHEYDTRLQPVMFDGSKLTHWNTPITKPGKYSLVFYNEYHHVETDKKKKQEDDDTDSDENFF